MSLPGVGVKQPVFTSMIFAAILLLGIISLRMLPRDMLPDIEIPSLTVVTLYPGASANDVEQQVTRPLEEVLAGVNNLKSITSQSRENVSFITLQFDWNSDLVEASASVRDYLEFTRRSLPDDASAPMLLKISSDMFPAIIYGISTRNNYGELENIIDDRIANTLKSAPGVGALVVLGKPHKEIRILADPVKMKAYGVNISHIAASVESVNKNIPSGTIETGADELSVSVPAGLSKFEQLEETIIQTPGGRMVRIKDVAEVRMGVADTKELVNVEGNAAVGIFVQKQAGSNLLEVVEAVRQEMEKIKPDLPDGIEVKELMDNSEMITATLNNLFITILYAAVFVILVVLFFLRKLYSSFIVLITIPFSLIVAFIFMYVAGFTINLFSLMSLAIATGMVIDNAIVVLENIVSHTERGIPPRQAAIFGTREMGLAIMAATFTTISVFFPLVFLDGVVGIMFRQLSVITAVTLLASLFAALLLTPMLASQIREKKQSRPNRFILASEQIFNKTEDAYSEILSWSLKRKTWIITIAVLIFGITLMSARDTGTDYIPEFDAGDISAVFETRPDASTATTMEVTREVEKIFREEIPEIRTLYSLTGQSDEGLLSSVGFREGKNVSTVFARTVLPENRDRSSKEIASRIRKRIDQIPEIQEFSISSGSLITSAVMGNIKPVQVEIFGNNLDSLHQIARHLTKKMEQSSYLTNIENTTDQGKPEFQIITDKQRLNDLYINQLTFAQQIRHGIHGYSAGEIYFQEEEVPVRIMYPDDLRNSRKDLENILVTGLTGENVWSDQVAKVVPGVSASEILRENQRRVVYIYAEPDNISLGQAAEHIREFLQQTALPSGVSVKISVQVEEQQKSFGNLRVMFIIGLLLVFMVMASQFESLKHPFIILFSVPFTLTGVIIAFQIAGLSLSVVTFLGVIMLLGIVVNNGIVLVDYTNLLRKRGQAIQEAILNASRSRLRPVLMTSFTTMLGMIPMVMSKGIGSEIWRPLAITMIGGLLVSTLVTLILIPVIYKFFHK